MFCKTDGIKYIPKRRSKSKRRNNKSKSRKRTKSTRRRIIKRSKSSKRRILKKSHKKDGMHSTKFKFFRTDMYDGITLYGVREEIYTYLYIYIPKDYLKISIPTNNIFKDKNVYFNYMVERLTGSQNAVNFVKHLKNLNLDVNNGYYFYIKIYDDDITDDQILQYMNEFYFKFLKYMVPIQTWLEKELLILEKDRAEVIRIEFKELIDEKKLEYLDNEINLIKTKIQKIENEKNEVLRKIRIHNEEMLFVIYKTIDDLREYFIKNIRNNEWKIIYSDQLNEYINLIRENEKQGLEDPLSENKFLLNFYKDFHFKSRICNIQDSKPPIFRDEEIIYITHDNYKYPYDSKWKPVI